MFTRRLLPLLALLLLAPLASAQSTFTQRNLNPGAPATGGRKTHTG